MTNPDRTEQKAALRKTVRLQCGSMTEKERQTRSEAAQNLILADPAWAAARSVGLYSAVRQELGTLKLMNQAWAEGKQVFLPYVPPGEEGVIRFLPCPGLETLVKGAFGIMEPDPASCSLPSGDNREPELIVVPALAYDRRGYRLGSGGGYYDRLFARPAMHSAKRLGLGYAFQLYEELPVEPWDIPMHGICTEEALLWLS